jgi:hypothetical protein
MLLASLLSQYLITTTMQDHSIEELLKIIGKEPDESQASPVEHKSKISDFINELNIEIGVDRITTTVVYYTYKVKYRGELSRIEFFRQFNKEGFIQARTGRQRYYLLNGGSFDLTREGKLKAEFYEQEEKDKKRQGKVSRSKSRNKSKA